MTADASRRYTEGFVDSGGVELHYLDWGGEGRPLVLLAGLGGTAHLFRGLAPRLRERFRVAGLTRRGHGRSARPLDGYDLETLVGDIRGFLDALGLERAILVGHSFAGLAYLDYHRRARPDLASIWCEAIEADRLEDMTIDGRLDPPAARIRQREVGRRLFEGSVNVAPDYGAVAAPMLAIVPAGESHPLAPADASEELLRAANQYWIGQHLPWIRRRTQEFRSAAPDARVVELDTSNHTIFIAREDETVRAIFEFVD